MRVRLALLERDAHDREFSNGRVVQRRAGAGPGPRDGGEELIRAGSGRVGEHGDEGGDVSEFGGEAGADDIVGGGHAFDDVCEESAPFGSPGGGVRGREGRRKEGESARLRQEVWKRDVGGVKEGVLKRIVAGARTGRRKVSW